MFTYIEYDKISKKQQNKFQNQLMQSLLLCIKRFHLKEYCTKNALTTIEFFYSFNSTNRAFLSNQIFLYLKFLFASKNIFSQNSSLEKMKL